MPKAVQKEFRHHSHTHPDATVASDTKTHNHATGTTFTNCGNPEGYSHRHNLTSGEADSHNHSVTVSFSAANLGSPWWNHVHAITLSSWANGGSNHTHTRTVNTTEAGCLYGNCNSPLVNRHHHVTSGYSFSSANGAHNHTLPAGNTDVADSGKTADSHDHTFTITSNYGDSHTHNIGTITISDEVCYYSYNHTHTVGSTSNTSPHLHTLTGTSGLGGEPAPTAHRFIGDGLTCVG